MNQDGVPNPKTAFDRSDGTSPHEDTIITNHEHIRTLDGSKHINRLNTSSLLSTCAKSDKGGGVGLNHEVFAIYSTAELPPLWTDILHTPAAGNVSSIIGRLHALADKISTYLPIYTSWNDIPHSSSNHEISEFHSLNITTTTQFPPSNHQRQSLHRKKPHFLLNAALHNKHCIIGQSSKTETLLVVLRRPWCVLEICVSNVHDVEVLEAIRAFARVAQEVDESGYGTAVFLLGVEIDARNRRRRRQMPSRDSRISYGRVYELCNTTVFIPSLRSFNSFWIRLICVCAIELGFSFSCMIHMLCDQQQPQVEYDQQNDGRYKSDTAFAEIDVGYVKHDGRRNSTELYPYSRAIAEEEAEYGDIVQKMLDLYKHVLKRTGDYI
jgi:hypothetical protein